MNNPPLQDVPMLKVVPPPLRRDALIMFLLAGGPLDLPTSDVTEVDLLVNSTDKKIDEIYWRALGAPVVPHGASVVPRVTSAFAALCRSFHPWRSFSRF